MMKERRKIGIFQANSYKRSTYTFDIAKNSFFIILLHTSRDQVFLLNVMETEIVSETKYGKTKLTQMKTSVLATVIINIKKLSSPLQSRFFIVTL